MTTVILAIEDSVFQWIFEYAPIIGTCLVVIVLAVWLGWKAKETFAHYTNRLIKVEYEASELKKDVKTIKRRITRMDKKVSGIDFKLDKLIGYLVTTKQIDKDVLK